MLSCCFKPLPEKPSKLQVRGSIHASHDLEIFGRKLEWGSLEPNISGSISQDKSKVDVNEMSIFINQEISIVSVLHLQEV
jgi:hypothetical protein